MMLLTIAFLSLVASVLSTNMSSCPIDLNYIHTIPWNTSVCQSPTNSNTANQICCQALLSLFGIGLAQHLKETSLFQLPDLPSASACVLDFQSKLKSLSLPPDIASTCFGSPERFQTGPHICAGIVTKQDWIDRLGPTTQIDTACQADLSDSSSCDACVKAGFKVQARLTSIDGNASHSTECFYFTILYAGGVVNEYGAESAGTAACIFGLPLSSISNSKGKAHRDLINTLIGIAVVVLLLLCALPWYVFWDNRQKRKKMTSFGTPDSEEKSLKLHLRLNTGSIWFKFEELDRATDNFSDNNLIGRGGFGVVYKGILSDGTLVAVKKMIEPDSEGNTEFCNEVEIISNLKHRNLVPLRGCCVSDEKYDEEQGKQRYLVYDYMPNGNLDDHLFFSRSSISSSGNTKALNWSQRKSIIIDVAKGLAYLHYGVKPSIYHRDIKATNILLDAEMKARVADFGPTITDALKMLEGDREIPIIPDRPLPLGDDSFRSRDNTFSLPPFLSEAQLNTGGLLR
ncbi:hypothetical protein IFM89_001764 [Coptis chinensis]|uniref:non-specific serine/threonine protein kinase n=1 Tax=Coptis chinensis TaxID=261450 RepID=A0A835HMW7_9MAGN|nr:hypothetical protein IFM89_001764 [Coptis chinensis]